MAAYVDCFSGSLNVRSENLEDSSFAIALNELRKARESHGEHRRNVQLCRFFLEEQLTAYARLNSSPRLTDAKVETRNSRLEGQVLINLMTGQIRRFLDSLQEQTQESFRRLFGSGTFREKVQGRAQQDRAEVAVEEHAANVEKTGAFKYVFLRTHSFTLRS